MGFQAMKFLAAISAALCLMGASAAMAQGKGESVKFQDDPGTGNTQIRVAITKGYCEKYGIKCELQMIPLPPLGAQAMLAKSIDSFFGPAAVMNSAIQKGAAAAGRFSPRNTLTKIRR